MADSGDAVPPEAPADAGADASSTPPQPPNPFPGSAESKSAAPSPVGPQSDLEDQKGGAGAGGAITVHDPVKQGDGIKSYISYKVSRDGLSVVRRYSDFVWLQERLMEQHPGYIVPPLPEKKQIGRFDPEFIEVRRRYLQRFLVRISQHPALEPSPDFRDFMRASEQDLQACKARASGGGRGFMQWFGETVMAVSQSLGSVEIPKTPEDKVFEDHCHYIDSLLPQMERVHKHARQLLENQSTHANCLFEFGLAFTLLGQSEADALGSSLSQLGHSADQLYNLTTEHVSTEAANFADPLRDYMGVAQSVRAALDARKDRQLTYHTAVADWQRAQRNLVELKSQGRANAGRVAAAEEAIAQAKVKQEGAKEQLDIVHKRVVAEMKRFKAEKLVDFRNIVLNYVEQQIEFQRQVEATWKKLLPELSAAQ